ncbi:MAG: ATP-binding protein [Deltaproteobacteria bacterium]|nr:ATP-binding protein [Deltaproteobacteria bacterium]
MNGENIKKRYLETIIELYRWYAEKFKIEWNLECYCDPLGSGYHESDIKNLKIVKKKIDETEAEFSKIVQEAEKKNVKTIFEEIAREYKLRKIEKYILMFVFARELLNIERWDSPKIIEILRLIDHDAISILDNLQYIENLIEKKIIVFSRYDEESYHFPDSYVDMVNESVKIASNLETKIMTYFQSQPRKKRKAPKNKKAEDYYYLQVRNPVISLKQLILSRENEEIVYRIINYKNIAKTIKNWGLHSTIRYGRGLTALFYGPPGTGKTATAEAIASALGKKIGIVRYSQILGMYVGESEKGIESVFEEAKKADCVLVFDEADALFAQRFYERHSVDRMHNYMTNILMQKTEQFDGIVILTTNRDYVMDEAYNRRILYKLKFDKPGPEERARIWRLLIPEKMPIDSDVNFRELGQRFELTGGEIKNAVLKAVIECAEKRLRSLPMSMLIKYAQGEAKNTKYTSATNTRIGFDSRRDKLPV